jgi:hypothetical protein
MIKQVEVFTVIPSKRQRIFFPISLIKFRGKASKQPGHCQVGFPMAIVDSRIDQNRFPGFITKIISPRARAEARSAALPTPETPAASAFPATMKQAVMSIPSG